MPISTQMNKPLPSIQNQSQFGTYAEHFLQNCSRNQMGHQIMCGMFLYNAHIGFIVISCTVYIEHNSELFYSI
jgi:hypothetical protein